MNTIINRTLEFLTMEYAFGGFALTASIAVGVLCAVVGTFLVLRGLALLGDATGHAALPGVCLGFLAAGGQKVMAWLLAGALVTGFLAAAAVAWISARPRTRPDAAIAVVLSVFFGAGIVLLSHVQNSPTGAQSGLNRFLFGNAAAVSPFQTYVLVGAAIVAIVAVVAFFRPLSITTFDPIFASAIGIPVRAFDVGLLTSLAICVVLSIQAVGVVLVSAMLIIPASTALLLSQRLSSVVVMSGLLGAASGFGGSWFSYVFEGVGTGPAMTLISAVFFVAALVFSPRRGLVAGWIRKRRKPRGEPCSTS